MEREDLYLYEYNYGGTIIEGMRNVIVGGKWFEISRQWTTSVVVKRSLQQLLGRSEVQNNVYLTTLKIFFS